MAVKPKTASLQEPRADCKARWNQSPEPSSISCEAAVFIVRVALENGLHARPSALVAEKAKEAGDCVKLELLLHYRGANAQSVDLEDAPARKTGIVNEKCNAKDLLAIAELSAGRGSLLSIIARGKGAFEAAQRVAEATQPASFSKDCEMKPFEIVSRAFFYGERSFEEIKKLRDSLGGVPREIANAIIAGLEAEFF